MEEELIKHIKNFNFEGVLTLLSKPELSFCSNKALQAAIDSTTYRRYSTSSTMIAFEGTPDFSILNLILNDHRVNIKNYLTPDKTEGLYFGGKRHKFLFDSVNFLSVPRLVFLNKHIYKMDIDFSEINDVSRKEYYYAQILNVDYLRNNLIDFLYYIFSQEEIEYIKLKAKKLNTQTLIRNF